MKFKENFFFLGGKSCMKEFGHNYPKIIRLVSFLLVICLKTRMVFVFSFLFIQQNNSNQGLIEVMHVFIYFYFSFSFV